ncbi:MAG: hypothetical protein HFJ58_07195 [Clostridia bacterium]|nr:hypothetical protein [Clostridia bacterium]
MKKKKAQKIRTHSYSFGVVKEDDISSRIIITRDDTPYCQFSKGVFMNPGGVGKKDMPSSEKILLWKHLNYYGDDVVHKDLTLSDRKNEFFL